MRIAILGGTGKEGSGLALRWARREEVVIGSRQREKAERIAGEVNEKLGEDLVRGLPNLDAAREAEVAVLTVPYSAHEATLAPLGEAGQSAAEEAQEILGPETHVVAAFQTVSFTLLQNLDRTVEGDVLVCSNFEDAMTAALSLAKLCGFRALDAGPLQNARVVEGLTPMLIHINRNHRVKHAGFQITGLDGH